MHKSATKCNETLGKWCKNKHGASKIIDTLETYQGTKTIVTKGTTVEAQDTVATEKKTTGAAKNIRQKNLENTTHHQRIC
jgi:hypothetical protein